MNEKILIVEDENKIAELLKDYLTHAGYECDISNNGLEAMNIIKKQQHQLLLLDLMLPGKDGVSICQDTRQFSEVPIIMLTARIDEVDRLLGLESGADDYICKPFSPKEVVARVKAVLRRVTQPVTDSEKQFSLDEDRLEVNFGDKPALMLTVVEFQLLRTLSSRPGRIWSRDQLMQLIYPDHRVVSDRTIDSHIKKLRHKLADHFGDVNWIDTVYGAGYRFQIED